MSRKHFQELADALRESKPEGGLSAAMKQWAKDVQLVANVCRSFNSNFDRGRFYAACGLVL